MHAAALIMAGGSAERFGGARKALTPVAGKPMVSWSVALFGALPEIKAVVLVVPAGAESEFRTAVSTHGAKVAAIVAGGATRQESVRIGLAALPAQTTHVLVHDAARPCASAELVKRVHAALYESSAVVPVVQATDTLVRKSGEQIKEIVERSKIAGVQTPQGFTVALLQRAHAQARDTGAAGTDDGSLVLALGEPLATVAGEHTNIKVTYPDDVAIAQAILSARP
ncbi:MAG: 2-C-methyl-D-erythritol 4-phosphate cytidylyltransferase [Candidatus Krumholzibacteria bacterium]|nr:2-C-methyl-D-erythritol 4-phosphate cytidylyltransferase [Candidatus Krumholzibacteria bacterium]